MSLRKAIEENNPPAVRRGVAAGAALDDPSLLKDAIANGNCGIIQTLIQAGMDPNMLDDTGAPLWFTCLPSWDSWDNHPFRPEVLDNLLENGADINALNQNGENALFYTVAVDASRTADAATALRMLIHNGIQPRTDKYGHTRLARACQHLELELVQALLDAAGFQPTGKNAELLSDLCRTHRNQPQGLLVLVQLLLRFGADANGMKSPPLINAVRHNLNAIVDVLLQNGADVNKPDAINDEPIRALILSLQLGHFDMAERLLKHGAHASEQETVNARLAGCIQTEKWTEALALAPAAIEANPGDWTVLYHYAVALRRSGQFSDALVWLRRAQALTFNMSVFNEMLIILIKLKLADEAIAYWEQRRDVYDAHAGIAYNIVCNVICAYLSLNRVDDALRETAALLTTLQSEPQDGVLWLNAACMYARAHQPTQALEYLLKAVSQNYDKGKIARDNDLNSLRALPLYDMIMQMPLAANGMVGGVVLQLPLQPSSAQEWVLREKSVMHRHWPADSDYGVVEEKILDTPFAALREYAQAVQRCTGQGFVTHALSPAESAWINALNGYFQSLTQQQTRDRLPAVGALVLEWDRMSDLPEGVVYYALVEKYQDMTDAGHAYRRYRGTDENTLLQDEFGGLERILSQDSFNRIIEQATRHKSFNNLNKQDTFFFVQQEHDSRHEFLYCYPTGQSS